MFGKDISMANHGSCRLIMTRLEVHLEINISRELTVVISTLAFGTIARKTAQYKINDKKITSQLLSLSQTKKEKFSKFEKFKRVEGRTERPTDRPKRSLQLFTRVHSIRKFRSMGAFLNKDNHVFQTCHSVARYVCSLALLTPLIRSAALQSLTSLTS